MDLGHKKEAPLDSAKSGAEQPHGEAFDNFFRAASDGEMMARRIRYLDETVVGTVSGLATTTHVNRQGYRLSRRHIVEGARQCLGLPFHVGHDTETPPIGKIVKSEVRELEDGEYGLWIEIELYDEEAMKGIRLHGGISIAGRTGPIGE